MQRYNFIGTLYMMCDALPKVSRLSRIFQLSTLDMSELHKHVSTTVEGLSSLISNPRKFLKFEYRSRIYTSSL